MNKKARTLFFYALNETLNLKHDVNVKLSRKRNTECVAEYLPDYDDGGNLIGHNITIYIRELADDVRPFDTILAHELIHAWQEEKGFEEIHGPHFQKMAAKIGKTYRLKNIYVRGADVP